MPDLDLLLRDLEGAPPPDRAPRLPVRIHPAQLALAAVALLSVGAAGFWLLDAPYRAERGGPVHASVDLRMAVDRDGMTYRVSRDGVCYTGEQVFFRVAAYPASVVSLWVEGPLGKEDITRQVASPAPTDLETDAGMLTYEFERTGTYTFVLAPAGMESCSSGDCEKLTLEVR